MAHTRAFHFMSKPSEEKKNQLTGTMRVEYLTNKEEKKKLLCVISTTSSAELIVGII